MRSKRVRTSVDYNEVDTDTAMSGNEDGSKFVKRARLEEHGLGDLAVKSPRASVSARSKTSKQQKQPNASTKSKSHYDPSKAGFMSLPAEIRLSIYKLVLVRDDCVDFCQRRNFAHSSHFLRLNRVIHEEGAAVLYGSNKFIFAPSKAKAGSLWEERWGWVGYRGIREFLEMIGTQNIASLKTIAMVFYDAAPSDEPKASTETRRFQNSQDLLSIIDILGTHATGTEMLKLSFTGRSRYHSKSNPATKNFYNLLVRLKADVVTIGKLDIDNSAWGLDPHEDWWTDRGGLRYQDFESNIYESEGDMFIKKITRHVPLNPSMVAQHEKFVADAEAKRTAKLAKFERLYGGDW